MYFFISLIFACKSTVFFSFKQTFPIKSILLYKISQPPAPPCPKEGTYHPSRPPFLQRREAQPLLLSLSFWHPRPIKGSGYSAFIPAYAAPCEGAQRPSLYQGSFHY